MIKTIEHNLIVQENEMYQRNKIKVKSNLYMKLMSIYSQAIEEVKREIDDINKEYNLVDHIKTRIKSPKSIVKKMKDKNYELTYQNMIDNINDIAGVRVIAKTIDDVYKIKNILENNSNITIIKEKDYIKKPKKSGYTSLHIIAEVPTKIDENIVFVKVEIQIRTIAMDLWANLEHEIKYKPEGKISKLSSIKLIKYAKLLNKIEKEMTEMYSR